MTEEEPRILVVEDDESTAELERRALARAGWLVQTVHRVNAAVALLKERSYCAIVLDYHLPDGEPWLLIEEANRTIPRTPVIMVTAMGSEGVAAEALHRGVSDYVMKAEGFLGELPKAVQRVIEAATAEQSLRVSDKLFQLIAGNLSDVILVTDLQGEVTYVSSACRSVLGYQPHELKTALKLDLVHADDRERVCAVLATITHSGQSSLIYRCRAKDGQFRWIESNINLFRNSANETAELIVISRDVTERKNAEEEINKLNSMLESRLLDLRNTSDALVSARQHADEANRAKSNFLATMSHEIRTPMNAILGMSDLLKETKLDPVQRQYVERCRRAGSNLLSLINDILDLSKIEAGRVELEQCPFDLVDLVAKAIDLLAPKAHMKKIRLSASIAPQSPLRLVGDSGRLQQILVNLIGNAVKFTEYGQIVLTVAPHESGQPGHLQFEVADTGIGIPASQLETIFDNFTQAESSTTRRFGGTGLGLGIARKLVQYMRGNLTVRSVVAEGSTFSFDAIFAVNQQAEPPRLVSAFTPYRKNPSTRVKILVAEDAEDNRFLVEAYLSDQAFDLRFVENGQEALDLFEQEKFDLVIMDVQMPVMDGLIATESIRAFERRHTRARTPILALTADALVGDAERSQAAGCDAHIVKPVTKEELVSVIYHTLFGRSISSSQVPDIAGAKLDHINHPSETSNGGRTNKQ